MKYIILFALVSCVGTPEIGSKLCTEYRSELDKEILGKEIYVDDIKNNIISVKERYLMTDGAETRLMFIKNIKRPKSYSGIKEWSLDKYNQIVENDNFSENKCLEISNLITNIEKAKSSDSDENAYDTWKRQIEGK